MKKISIIVIAIVLVIVALSTFKSEELSIKIGAVIPQTGFGSYWGSPVLKGIKLAEADLNKDFPNANIQILIEDSQSQAAAAASAAQKLISIDGVDALYSEFSGMSSAVSPIAQNAGKVFMYSTFNQKIAEDNPTSIKTFTSFEVACDKFANQLDSAKKILILSAISDAASYCEKALLKKLPASNVKKIEGFVGTDFKTVLLQNKQFAPDYIIPIMYEDGSYALIKQNHDLGMKFSFFCYKQDCVTEKLLKELPQAATENIMYFEIPIDPEFVQRIKAVHPEISNDDIQGAANAYQSMIALGEGLVACEDRSAQCVTDNLANKKTLLHAGYRDAKFVDRILSSEITLNIVHDGKGEIVK